MQVHDGDEDVITVDHFYNQAGLALVSNAEGELVLYGSEFGFGISAWWLKKVITPRVYLQTTEPTYHQTRFI